VPPGGKRFASLVCLGQNVRWRAVCLNASLERVGVVAFSP
jgi:hypothetical protein